MTNYQYDNKSFCSVTTSTNGDVDAKTIFHYKQTGNVVTAEYYGGNIVFGHLIAVIGEDRVLDMRYHHINLSGQLMTGKCLSSPEIMPSGKIRLHEKWKWTSGDESEGESILEEI
jgi:hypothetical protein